MNLLILPGKIMRVTDFDGKDIASINTENEVEIFCKKEALDEAIRSQGVDAYYRCICILFKCIMSLGERGK